jgi:hypothetical protein
MKKSEAERRVKKARQEAWDRIQRELEANRRNLTAETQRQQPRAR